MTWFGSKAPGLKADINRHRAKEAELDEHIAELENKDNPDDMDVALLKTFRELRAKLLQSKADVVSKIGGK